MKKWFGALLHKIKYPPKSFLVFFYPAFALTVAGTILLLVCSPNKTALHFVCYALSAGELVYFICRIAHFLPKLKSAAVIVLQRHAFTKQILESYPFRTVAFVAASVFLNIAYTALQAISGIFFRSLWNIAIAAFYLVLIALKAIILSCEKKHKGHFQKQLKTYRACGYMFNLLTGAMIGILVLTAESDIHYEYAGNMIYATAAYTFYKIVSAIAQFIKAKKQDDLTIRAIRNINLVSAVYSVLILQVSLTQAFDDGQNPLLNGITGGVTALIVLSLSVSMIAKSHKIESRTDPHA